MSDINRTETFIFNYPLPSPHVVVLRFVLLLCTSSLSSSSPPSSSSSPLCSRTRTHVHKGTYDFVVVSQSSLHGRTETTGCCCRRCHKNVSHGNGAVDRIHRRLVINIQTDERDERDETCLGSWPSARGDITTITSVTIVVVVVVVVVALCIINQWLSLIREGRGGRDCDDDDDGDNNKKWPKIITSVTAVQCSAAQRCYK